MSIENSSLARILSGRDGLAASLLGLALFFVLLCAGQAAIAQEESQAEGSSVLVHLSHSEIKLLGLKVIPRPRNLQVINKIPGYEKSAPERVLPAKVEIEWSDSGEIAKITLISRYLDSIRE